MTRSVEVVDTGEVVRTPGGRDRTGVEQVLERRLAVVPVPPLTLRTPALLQVAGDQCALVADPSQHVGDEIGSTLPQRRVTPFHRCILSICQR